MYKLPGVNAWSDFFDLEDMARGVPIMHQKDFKERFNLPNPKGRTVFPSARGGWSNGSYVQQGWQGIWEISKCYGVGEDEVQMALQADATFCIPSCPKPGSEFYRDLQHFQKGKKPKLVDTSTWENTQIVHFSQNGLGHWYSAMYLWPKSRQLRLKRQMKTFCHFNDAIFDAAESILKALLKKANSFSCMHIRRGDFQFKEVWTPVDEILSNTAKLFQPGEHMWIMTEEKKPHEFFAELKNSYQVHFLADYLRVLGEVNKATLPMIESVICSRARVFSGTWLSTLSGYITRLRGYMEDTQDKGVYFNQFKYPDEYQDWDVKYPTWKHSKGPNGRGVPGWAREYREVWDFEWDATNGG
mmetsp:Transcript_39580/g.93971  ORF Transcript_39580/g.93971 Transcript_39580/m.93971 type:complete len:357 (-) Transcript_39580:84-1154(-)